METEGKGLLIMPVQIVINIEEVLMPDGIKRVGMSSSGKGENPTARESQLGNAVRKLIVEGARVEAMKLPGAQRVLVIERDGPPA